VSFMMLAKTLESLQASSTVKKQCAEERTLNFNKFCDVSSIKPSGDAPSQVSPFPHCLACNNISVL